MLGVKAFTKRGNTESKVLFTFQGRKGARFREMHQCQKVGTLRFYCVIKGGGVAVV